MTKNLFWSFALFPAVFLSLAANLLAAEDPSSLNLVSVTEVRAPQLVTYADASPSKMTGQYDKTGLSISEARCCSQNLMVWVKGKDAGGMPLEGWVMGFHVVIDRSNEQPNAECDQEIASVQTGAVRGLGEGCD